MWDAECIAFMKCIDRTRSYVKDGCERERQEQPATSQCQEGRCGELSGDQSVNERVALMDAVGFNIPLLTLPHTLPTPEIQPIDPYRLHQLDCVPQPWQP